MIWKLGFEGFGNWDFRNFGSRDFLFGQWDFGAMGLGLGQRYI